MFNPKVSLAKRCCFGLLCEPNGATVHGRISIDVGNQLTAQVPSGFGAEHPFVTSVIGVSSSYYADSASLLVVWSLLFVAQRDMKAALLPALPVYV